MASAPETTGPNNHIMIERAANGWTIRVDSQPRPFVSRDDAGVVEIVAQILRVDAEVHRGKQS